MSDNRKFKKTLFSYAAGAFGHDVFYAALSSYLIMFITSQLFNSSTGGGEGYSEKMIAIVATMLFVLRFVELLIDPIIGGVVDNTRTRWGKFKPWILFGGTVGSVCIALLYTDLGGLSTSNPTLYIIMFVVIFAVLDIVYSFKDIAFWGMIPALATTSKERETVGVCARMASTIAQSLVTFSIVPIVLFFSKNHSQTANVIGDKQGWMAFGLIVAAVSLIGGIITVIGAKEQNNVLRNDSEKTTILKVFKAIAQNDQLLWLSVAYGLFALGQVICNSFVLYYFTYIFGNASEFAVVGTINLVIGFVSVLLFPILSRVLNGRKNLFIVGVTVMIVGMVIFGLADKNLPMILSGYVLFFFPYPMMFLCVLLTITDCVEYGQLKTGTRSEGVTLCVRPLLDKLAGAISNGVVGFTAIWVAMTNSATADSVAANPENVIHFKMIMFGLPIALFVIAIIVFAKKVKLTEKYHADIVDELTQKLENK